MNLAKQYILLIKQKNKDLMKNNNTNSKISVWINLRCGPFWIDAIVGRSIYRGYQMNTKYAEAFEIVKTVQF